ncbi:MAG: malto-oligosyltrehalose synthase [Acidimicrobiales bacterium]
MSTYRLQLLPHTTLADAIDLVPYLDALGVTHVYLAPLLQAAAESTHGYDVVDHQRIDGRIGTDADLERLVAVLVERSMGVVVDIVPNHMATRLPDNAWLLDVLEHGAASRFARHFDVDWDDETRIHLPILGKHYGQVLDQRQIALRRTGARFEIVHHEHVLPVGPRSLADIVARAAEAAGSDDLLFVSRSLERLPPASTTDLARRRERHRDLAVIRAQLDRLLAERPAIPPAIDAELAAVNADPDRLHDVLEAQAYRLAHWRTASEELGYRRFFDIDTLIGLRVEDPVVFDDVHRLVIDHHRRGLVDGVRVDHPDGLRRPGDYLQRLRQALPEAWIVIEKILGPDEALRPAWPVDGTTGYEYLNLLTRLFVDPAADGPLRMLAAELTGDDRPFAAVAAEAKEQILEDVLGAELNRLDDTFAAACDRRRTHRDVTSADRREALVATLVAFDVYRTYVGEEGEAEAEDQHRIDDAVAEATRRRPDVDELAFDLLAAILRGDITESTHDRELRMRFQQLSGPVMAKGVEDTACYRYTPLVALDEVGGEPDHPAAGLDDFHEAARRIIADHPATMITTSTHDTKRGADVRLRLAVLSERTDRWATIVRRWFADHERFRLNDAPAPGFQYLLYQTMVAAHPLDHDRLTAYALKALREAKEHSSWSRPDTDHERGVERFLEALSGDGRFRRELDELVMELDQAWAVTSLAHSLVSLTMPGVPDLYQGTELWDLSLVDPDNRRPVDFERRRTLLADMAGASFDDAWSARADGRAKLWLVGRALRARRQHPEIFGRTGGYRELTVDGAAATHLVAFARTAGPAPDAEAAVITLAPRLVTGLAAAGGWTDTTVELPPGRWHDVLADTDVEGGRQPVAEILFTVPMALLTRR